MILREFQFIVILSYIVQYCHSYCNGPVCRCTRATCLAVFGSLQLFGARLPMGLNRRHFKIHGRLCASMRNSYWLPAVAPGASFRIKPGKKPGKTWKNLKKRVICSPVTFYWVTRPFHGAKSHFCRKVAQSLTASSLGLSQDLIRTPTLLWSVANNSCFEIRSIIENQWQEILHAWQKIISNSLPMQHQHILLPDCSFQHGSRALSTAESYLPHLLCLPCCKRDPRVDTFCAQKFIKQEFLSIRTHSFARKHGNWELSSCNRWKRACRCWNRAWPNIGPEQFPSILFTFHDAY